MLFFETVTYVDLGDAADAAFYIVQSWCVANDWWSPEGWLFLAFSYSVLTAVGWFSIKFGLHFPIPLRINYLYSFYLYF